MSIGAFAAEGWMYCSPSAPWPWGRWCCPGRPPGAAEWLSASPSSPSTSTCVTARRGRVTLLAAGVNLMDAIHACRMVTGMSSSTGSGRAWRNTCATDGG